jgi:uncharacterized damage-inducible protein DinB
MIFFARSPLRSHVGEVITYNIAMADKMRYRFLIDTYATERLKVLSVWSMFHDEDLPVRPHPTDHRGRSVREQMIHQCMSEDLWFRTMLGIHAAETNGNASPLPAAEARLAFLARYAEDSLYRLHALESKDDAWWEQTVKFFDTERSRAWVMVRRIAHTAHHRGQQMALLRMLGRDLHSNYGPTADTGGLMQNGAKVIYAYPDAEALLEGEASGGRKAPLPAPGAHAVTERP